MSADGDISRNFRPRLSDEDNALFCISFSKLLHYCKKGRWSSIPKVTGSTPIQVGDFPDAENRQQPCRMIIRHEKDPLSVRLAWMLSTKLNS
ncbi:hypothetical protein TNCV_4426881 [Trichonephila clavipes]|nr:hypothetical protein TNCV_4426881 [Trichonephila clavipes]